MPATVTDPTLGSPPAAAATSAGEVAAAGATKPKLPNIRFGVNGSVQLPGIPPMNKEAFKRWLEQMKVSGKIDGDSFTALSRLTDGGLNLEGLAFENGGLTDRYRNPTTVDAVVNAGGVDQSGRAPPPTAPSSPGGGGTSGQIGGGSGGGAGFPSRPGGGGGMPNYDVGAGGGWSGQRPRTEETTAGVGGSGPAAINPRAPLGFPSVNPQNPGGSSYFGGGATPLPGATNPFAGLGPNSSLMDVIGQVAGAQVGNRNAALSALGGVFNESQGGVSAQLRGRTSDLLANPFSLDEATINQMQGRSTDAINQRTNRMSQQAADRAAGAGLRGDGGTVLGQQQAIQQSGANQVGQAERDIRIRAAETNKNDLRSALGAASGAIGEDLGRRERIANTAATNVLGETAITGDMFLTNALLASQGAPNQYPVYNPGMRYGG